MPKYWGKNYFAHGTFPEVGQKHKTEKEKKEEKLNDGDNYGQATHGARKHAWRTQARMAHASRLGQYAWRTQAAWAKNDAIIFMYLGFDSLCEKSPKLQSQTKL